MINRVLIRIKVVQMLYSYFLVQNNFAVMSSPEAPTKEKRFAYALYLDYLYLMTRIAGGIKKADKKYPLENTRFIQRLASDNIMKSLRNKYASKAFPLAPAIDYIIDEVNGSAVFKKFLNDPLAEPTIWPEIFRLFIYPDRTIAAIAEQYENYSLRGMDRAKEMIEDTFREFASSQDNVAQGLAELKTSLDKARELYFRLLMLPVDLTLMQERKLEEHRSSYLRRNDALDANPKFIDNELVKLLANSDTIRNYADTNKVSWMEQDPEMLEHLLARIKESELYRKYMDDPMADLHDDCEFWKKAMRNIIFQDEDFLEMMEQKSVYWNDDLDIMGEFAIKTFRRMEEKANSAETDFDDPVFPMYKDAEDAKFGAELFEATVKRAKIYREYINEALNTQHWDSERLAYMDVVIMMTALAEIFSFPKIPIQASLNEYIEIAKSYSSAKSGTFINGLLANVITNLKESGKLRK